MACKRYSRNRILISVAVVILVVYLLSRLKFLEKRTDQSVIEVEKWLVNPTTGCDAHFTGYGYEFVVLKYARVDKVKRMFSIPCKGKIPKYKFLFGKEGSPLPEWLENMSPYPPADVISGVGSLKNVVTIVVMRIEAHNLYHTLCEWYNVFLLSKLLHFDAKQADILFLDDRPPGLMDETWDALFGKVTGYSDLETNAVFKELIWNVIGYESPVNFHEQQELPFVNEFYHFFIQAFGVEQPKSLDCEKIVVTLIWRRDYMSHPERKDTTGGMIHRKFQNEKEIMDEVTLVFKGHVIRAVVLEEMGMNEQVKLFTNTDILIGMHGAGMAHVMFLPCHAAVLELFPNYWGFLKHFKASARWRRLKYLGWQNNDPRNEFPNFHTRIPPDVIRSHSQQLKEYICP